MMFSFVLFFMFFATSPVLTAVYTDRTNFCSVNEFSCDDGACVSLDRWCDGTRHCADGSDEATCDNVFSTKYSFLNRLKRQAGCRRNQFKCRDGSCIRFDGKCDGAVDCADGSDETHALCRKTSCQPNLFRCTYGACVDGTAPCNGEKECADNSDELLPRCRNETEIVKGRFKCANGQFISAFDHCDGVPNCADGSDENIRTCAGNTCQSHLFQCAYGACVNMGADCNGVTDCLDGSDESDELCDRIGAVTTTTASSTGDGACRLPPYPEHGSYKMEGAPYAKPGQAFDTAFLNITCDPGYGIVGRETVYCHKGSWLDTMPQCVRYCNLNPHPSVTYYCQVTGANNLEGYRLCNQREPHGTKVKPECNRPNYYDATGLIGFMTCIDGSFDYVAICSPECGKVTPEGDQLVIGGTTAKHGELPWHAGIYTKTTDPYMQICGGSLVSTTLVISAAHCFWTDASHLIAAKYYAVALGKIYRPWNNAQDKDAQKFDVSEIRIPPRFAGQSANFQEDIALVKLSASVVYKTYVRPVCIDFDVSFDDDQLKPGYKGKVAGWGLTAENGPASQVLKVLDIPYVDINTCIAETPATFREYITSDKICAGAKDGTALCKGDSGGGLAFPDSGRSVTRFYLRGIVSTAPKNDNLCNAFVYTTFTQIIKHETFIKTYLNNK